MEGRREFLRRLEERGERLRPFLYPFPCHVEEGRPATCPEAPWLAARGLSLPTWVGMPREHVRRVADALRDAIAQ